MKKYLTKRERAYKAVRALEHNPKSTGDEREYDVYYRLNRKHFWRKEWDPEWYHRSDKEFLSNNSWALAQEEKAVDPSIPMSYKRARREFFKAIQSLKAASEVFSKATDTLSIFEGWEWAQDMDILLADLEDLIEDAETF